MRSVCGARRDGPPGCGALIDLVRVLADEPRRDTYVALNLAYDPACGIPPSHATNAHRSLCRPLHRGEAPAPSEHPALHHNATCPVRHAYDIEDPA